MKMKLFLPLLSIFSFIWSEEPTVYIYTGNDQSCYKVMEALDKSNIKFELTDKFMANNEQNLYLIFDILNIPESDLPKYYIAYQSLDLSKHKLNDSYLRKLSNSIVTWDYSKENISRYNSSVYNCLHYPNNYEYADLVFLPCRLPVSALDSYKELLIDSNKNNTDISSHLPTLFCHAVLQNPKIIVEAGVRGGESTKPLKKAMPFCGSTLIGVDIDSRWEFVYSSISNAQFFAMDDLEFGNYYTKSTFKDQKIDMVFIDTSHLYEHTLKEITMFVPLLSEKGMLSFHDSNVTPLVNNTAYVRLNGSGDYAPGNTRGVTQAIKEYFSLEFNEHAYCNTQFTRNGVVWNITHYPFCNGLTLIRKIKTT